MKSQTIVKLFYCFIVFAALVLFLPKNVCASETEPHLVINEVYYDTTSIDADEEWIELYNPTADDIALDNFELSYSAHKITISIDETIASKEFTVIARNPSNFYSAHGFEALNSSGFNFDLPNSGGYLVLKNNNGDEIDAVFWEKNELNNMKFAAGVATGHSIEREPLGIDTDDCSKDFVDRKMPTPGAEYIQQDEKNDENDPIDIDDARELEDGEEVNVEGIVTVLPGVLSTQYFYIQDETGGIQIYCYGKTFPALQIGDRISVTGELSETNNERRIKYTGLENIVILFHTEPVIPQDIGISDIGESEEGELVKMVGIVTRTSGNTFYISDGQKEIKVIIKDKTGIVKPKMKKGDEAEITGIVSQYKDEYRILPIDQDDVIIVASDDLLPRAGTGGGVLIYFAIAIGGEILWNIYQRAKKKRMILRIKFLAMQNRAIYLRFTVI